MQEIQLFIPDKNDFFEFFDDMKKQIKEIKTRLDSIKPSSTVSEEKPRTRKETASELGISLPTLDKHRKNGLPSQMIGGKRVFYYSQVKKYFDEVNKKPR